MSALLVDEVSFDGLRTGGGRRGFDHPQVLDARRQRSAGRASDLARADAGSGRQAPCEWGAPIVERPRSSVRLTDRGIAVVLAVFVGLFIAAVAVVVTSFLAVSDAPLQGSAVGVSGVVRTVG